MTTVASDYDRDPDRWRTSRRAVDRYATTDDVHPVVAARLAREHLTPVLDVGCGDGRLPAVLDPGVAWIGADRSPTQIAAAPRPVMFADAAELPARDASVGAVAALWMLYHLDDPVAAIAEAHRVLRPGGLFITCTTRRDDSPELLEHLPPQPASTFDAEEAPDLVARVFAAIEVDPWDGPFVRLPDRAAVADYLRGRAIDAALAHEVSRAVRVPLTVTKRGVLIWARKAAR